MIYAIGKYLRRRLSKGIEDGKVVIWYMETVQDAIETEEQLYTMQCQVLAVIDSMIKDGDVAIRGRQSKLGSRVLALKKSATEKYVS